MRVIERKWMESGKDYVEMAGTSTESKPTTNIVTGSLFLEVDTGSVFAFNEEAAPGEEWVEL